ncbi:CbtB domain-containing protein [Actinophytocola xanthii]|uniref:Cobalt transporter n=1 Tax=Actinophytocola xanthii TaxID=1912961 RepID=A0A1Q8BZY6_9PSEU|nr:CbtB-domain containing protein [Actinophytocola xanthii]OLF07663.1 cobalt transporter [Actinophytocola xanthii]
MSQAVPAAPEAAVPTIPLGQIAPWAVFVGLVALTVLFFVSAGQGAVSFPAGDAVHEWVHDGRHLLGFPCH